MARVGWFLKRHDCKPRNKSGLSRSPIARSHAIGSPAGVVGGAFRFEPLIQAADLI
jgi:hypothetical protein